MKAFFDIRKGERVQSALMFGYFFLVITSFWILKPVKKAVFITYYDETGFLFGNWHMSSAQAELFAKCLNMVIAYVAAVGFIWLSNRFVRQQLSTICIALFIPCYVGFSYKLDAPTGPIVWSFYLFGDLFSTLMIAAFFVFLNDIVTPDQAKRTYGLVGLGGVSGGVLGSTVVSGLIRHVPLSAWMWICLVLALMMIAIAVAVGRIAKAERQRSFARKEPETTAVRPRNNAVFEGVELVARSRYMLAIVGIVGIYEMVSTIMDYQFSETVSHYLQGDAIGQQFAVVYSITNGVALFVQLFVTSHVMKQHGIKVALLVLPVAVFLGSFAFIALPVLWIGSLLNTADNAFSYSINQSAKESLYVPASRQEKYKAKAFIDMFVQRLAKVAAVLLSFVLTAISSDFAGVRWLSLVTVFLVVIWFFLARYAGEAFEGLARVRSDESAGVQA
ncbi:MAG: MFS transporter [Deltaproteobacteria bacterium]|nr:MFS transporter [Deltaproteobacteria bacterium]